MRNRFIAASRATDFILQSVGGEGRVQTSEPKMHGQLYLMSRLLNQRMKQLLCKHLRLLPRFASSRSTPLAC